MPKRTTHLNDLRDQCHAEGVAFFFKQWGEWAPDTGPTKGGIPSTRNGDPVMHGAPCAIWTGKDWDNRADGYAAPVGTPNRHCLYRVGKKAAGRLLDGREWNQMPKGHGA